MVGTVVPDVVVSNLVVLGVVLEPIFNVGKSLAESNLLQSFVVQHLAQTCKTLQHDQPTRA